MLEIETAERTSVHTTRLLIYTTRPLTKLLFLWPSWSDYDVEQYGGPNWYRERLLVVYAWICLTVSPSRGSRLHHCSSRGQFVSKPKIHYCGMAFDAGRRKGRALVRLKNIILSELRQLCYILVCAGGGNENGLVFSFETAAQIDYVRSLHKTQLYRMYCICRLLRCQHTNK
jgi:hypothetical protein